MPRFEPKEGVFDVVMTNFVKLSGSTFGSAIYQNKENSHLHVNYCKFIGCKATRYAGGICSQKSADTLIAFSCFTDNEADFAPSFMLWANVHDFINGEVHESSEVSLPSRHSSGLGGRAFSSFTKFNNSHFKTSTQEYCTFCLTGNDQSKLNIEYFLIHNATSPYVFGSWATNALVKKSTLIQCNATSFAQKFTGSVKEIEIEECVIHNCIINSVGYATLNNCQIDNQITNYIGSTVANPSFFKSHIIACNQKFGFKTCMKKIGRSQTCHVLIVIIFSS